MPNRISRWIRSRQQARLEQAERSRSQERTGVRGSSAEQNSRTNRRLSSTIQEPDRSDWFLTDTSATRIETNFVEHIRRYRDLYYRPIRNDEVEEVRFWIPPTYTQSLKQWQIINWGFETPYKDHKALEDKQHKQALIKDLRKDTKLL